MGEKRRVGNYSTQVRRVKRGAGLNYHLNKAEREAPRSRRHMRRDRKEARPSVVIQRKDMPGRGRCAPRRPEEASVAGLDGGQ